VSVAAREARSRGPVEKATGNPSASAAKAVHREAHIVTIEEILKKKRNVGRGIWKGSYVEPWLYRACIRAGGCPAECSDDANDHQ
jgi:hypothetical protein